MSKSTHPNRSKSAESSAHHPYAAAFEETAAARAKLDDDDLLTINLDVQVALTRVIGAVPAIHRYRDSIKASLPTVDIAKIDQLLTYAEALAVAHGDCVAAAAPPAALPALHARAIAVRDQLLLDAQTLASRGLIDEKRVARIKRGPGYLNMTSDLAILVRVLREKWSEISSKSAIQLAELDEAHSLFEEMTSAYGARKQRCPVVAAAALERKRAYTLLLDAYDEARRALSFLRWRERDVETIAPSLWAGRGKRSTMARAAKQGTTAPDAVAARPSPQVVAADGTDPNTSMTSPSRSVTRSIPHERVAFASESTCLSSVYRRCDLTLGTPLRSRLRAHSNDPPRASASGAPSASRPSPRLPDARTATEAHRHRRCRWRRRPRRPRMRAGRTTIARPITLAASACR